MLWQLSTKADDATRLLANKHYNRQKPESPQFAPPGRTLILRAPGAFWITSWPYAEYVKHRWTDGRNCAWVCTAFRREPACPLIASELIVSAVAATRWYHQFGGNPSWRNPEPHCFVTFVDPSHVRPKRDYGRASQAGSSRPGRCYIKAGWVADGLTELGLPAFILPIASFPVPEQPLAANWMTLTKPSKLAQLVRKAL